MKKSNLSLLAYNFLRKKNIVLAYIGSINSDLISSILSNVKEKVLFDKSIVSKRFYSILVESLENIIKHTDDPDSNSFLFIYKYSSHFCIVTGNKISNSSITDFKKQLDIVKSSDSDVLRNMYREQIVSERISDNQAGLGILDIAIKSNNNIEYKFIPLDGVASIYLLQTKIYLS